MSTGGIVRTKPSASGSFSGMLKPGGGCRRETKLSTGYVPPAGSPDHCVQYGVSYDDGSRLRFEEDIGDAEESYSFCPPAHHQVKRIMNKVWT